MGDSYRIRTEIGVSKTISVQLDQDFEFLEILSLKIQQAEIYTRSCAEYGVVVGRVVANKGFGIPNARVSIFIPINGIDQSNPEISSIYPYKSINDKNEDGYRYNLLPYEKSYSTHAATGTFPSRLDALTANTAIDIYNKYYKLTAVTNESGDYMIFGVPTGVQNIFMDLDLSDIGEFSLTPQDLIRMGLATESQIGGSTFESSTDLDSLPQIISIEKTMAVSPLWGDPTICQISINRVDFDLRDEANIDIQPTAVFIGSIFSSPDDYKVTRNKNISPNLGKLCELSTNYGQIIALRQTIFQDSGGLPILERYRIENSGKVIDEDGTWILELPMNLEYVITNEFGQKVISFDPSIGIPTKGKYRFKIKWDQPSVLTSSIRRPHFLVPNVKEYGWPNPSVDPNSPNNTNPVLASSYYFGLDWSGYTDGFFGNLKQQRLQEIVNCEDTFYEFSYNRVYTIASLVDECKRGGRASFIGIKEIENENCKGFVNPYPINTGYENLSGSYFFFAWVMMIWNLISLILITMAHVIFSMIAIIMAAVCVLTFGLYCDLTVIDGIPLRMLAYPSCKECECGDIGVSNRKIGAGTNGVLTFVSEPTIYRNKLAQLLVQESLVPPEDQENALNIYSQVVAGNTNLVPEYERFKMPKSDVYKLIQADGDFFGYSHSLTLGERINLFNTRSSYFSGVNKIGVTFSAPYNPGVVHFDNTITVLCNKFYNSGELLTTVDPLTTADLNFKFPSTGITSGISGNTVTGSSTINVSYAVTEVQNSNPVSYFLPEGSIVTTQAFPMDREYFQVVTAITVSQFTSLWNTGTTQYFPNILTSPSDVYLAKEKALGLGFYQTVDEPIYSDDKYQKLLQSVVPFDLIENIENKYVLILQRGVDPYSPKYENQYRLGNIFGKNIDDIVITASTRINIPIQKLDSSSRSVQEFNQNEMFFPSYFFTPGDGFSAFSTNTLGFYAALDAQYSYPDEYLIKKFQNGVTTLITKTDNAFYSNSINASKYDLAEDVSGAAFVYSEKDQGFLSVFTYDNFDYKYFTPNAFLYFKDNPIFLSNKNRNIIRTDRLPSSDKLNGESWETNPALLQQNNNFTFYTVGETGPVGQTAYPAGGGELPAIDIDGLPYAQKIVESFECANMVDLDCYIGYGDTFGINPKCYDKNDGFFSELGTSVQNGCYVFVRRPFFDLYKDWSNLIEWNARYKFTYGLCQNIISQAFSNNWVNGSLYMFPIQTVIKNSSSNNPINKYPNEFIYFDVKTANFYYRSSPYMDSTDTFVGQYVSDVGNKRNLLFPTTIVDLGVKSSFYQEIIFEPSVKSFIVPYLTASSYGDPTQLIYLFGMSKLMTASTFAQAFSTGNARLGGLFSNEKVEGSLAQLMSINSEIGVQKFSTEFYDGVNLPAPPIQMFQGPKVDSIGVWFSSTTLDLQIKDFLTPGSLNFTTANSQSAFNFRYGIKSQKVPFYKWRIKPPEGAPKLIFGQLNSWATEIPDLFAREYQSLDRTQVVNPGYFQSSTVPTNNLSYRRGYIFSTDVNGVYSSEGMIYNKILVGAPFHFYFGVKAGASVIDKFRAKYLSDE